MIRIAQAVLSELEHLVPLFDQYRQFYEQPSDPGGARRFLRERLERSESVAFLAYAAESPVGFAQLYPCFSSVSLRRIWILNDLFVAPEARRQGVAEALLDRARQLAIDTGAKGVQLATAIDNASAQRLYERFGYIRDAKFFHYFQSAD